MDLSGSYFEYNGTTSRKYGLIFAHVETEGFVRLSGEIKSSIIFNKNGKRNYFIGESFEGSPLQFDAEVVMDDGRTFDRYTRHEIEKWLFHQHNYCKLYLDPDCDTYGDTYELINGVQKRLYLNCRFTNPEKIEGNGGLAGYKFTIECDSCMAWQDAVVFEHTLSPDPLTKDSVVTVEVDTDLRDYIYPKVTILTGGSGGNIQIINYSDDITRETSFVNLSPNVTFTMKGEGINYISGDYYLKFSDKNFIRLLDGENTIHIVGDVAKITFEFQNRRYL